MKDKKGIALILAVGILAVLAVMATSFALTMRLEYKAAMNYYYGVKARYAAEAALQSAIAGLKAHVKSSAFDYFDATNEPWSINGYSATIPISESSLECTTTIVDEQRKININKCTITLLSNLITILKTYGSENHYAAGGIKSLSTYTTLQTGDATTIINNRGSGGYLNIQDIIARSGVDKAKIELLAPFITTYSYVDPNNLNYSTINVNTADRAVIAAVLVTNSALTADVAYNTAANGILNNATYKRPYKKWQDFNNAIDAIILASATAIKNDCNPNKTQNTKTKFCFHSGGYYTITATGEVKDDAGATKAENTLVAIVKIYDIYNATIKADFADPDSSGGAYARVTWLDDCPVNSSALFGNPSALVAPQPIAGSIKLGYWDNFSEDSAYSTKQWNNSVAFASGYSQYGNNSSGGNALTNTENVRRDLLVSTSPSAWNFNNFSLRASFNEYDIPSASQMKDVAWVLFRHSNSTSVIDSGEPAILHTKNKSATNGTLTWLSDSRYAYLIPLNNSVGSIELMTISEYRTYYQSQTGYGRTDSEAITDRYKYGDGQLRIFTSFTNNAGENWDNTGYGKSFLYNTSDRRNVFNIIANGANVTVNAWTPTSGASPATFTRNISGTDSSGRFVLYGSNVKVAWDDIRIIPQNGTYTSRTISPTGSNVEWGTITGTLTQSTAVSGKQGDITLQTSESGSNSVSLKTAPEPLGPALAIGTSSSTIRYTANLTSNDTEMEETPILEDVTITYLQKTDIISYTLSPQ